MEFKLNHLISITLKRRFMSINKYIRHAWCFTIMTSFIFFLSACSSDSAEESDQFDDEQITEEEKPADKETKVKKPGKVFYTIPSPLELTSIIKKAGADYDKTVCNSVDNLPKYLTMTSMALNLGIYGADLSYSSIFEQTQETMHYFAACKRLADDLGITSAFGESTVKRIQKNLNNRDSLISIISDSYWETDAYLKENNRSSTSALVIAGGWIEGLYVSVNIAGKTENNKDIVSRIGEQKLTLGNLIAMLQHYSDEEVKPIIADLQDLRTTYNGVVINYTRREPITDSESKITILQTTSEITIGEAELAAITEKVKSIRNNIVK